ncbi:MULTISPECIES: hypothetical protein [unclassified Sphingomonas]|jgi:hypothetical protein|uniref:hypothetical protein n=1 Tax=unclassified Sphingomonas TaxID=196159 RepID=UPI0005A9D977|nr:MULTISPECIES: hypothetical protein [unclassified Sphingomonas]MDY1009662.1 hypothetical protein [Sphingomonas sp. CFBP9019]
MFALLLVLAQDPLLAKASERLAAEPRCVVDPASTDITVCGLRQADRFRVPFVEHDPGDPRHESLAAERVRLLNARTPVQDMGPFQVGGGMAGVSVGVGAAGVTAGGLRKPAP